MHRIPISLRRLAILAAVTGSAVALAGCGAASPDVTRQRVEDDLAGVWTNQAALLARTRDRPAIATSASATCDKGGPKVPDSGPGKNWVCEITPRADGKLGDPLRYEVAVRGEACYTAILPALIEKPTVQDARTRKFVANPIEAFDGCFDVYDDKTRTTGPPGPA